MFVPLLEIDFAFTEIKMVTVIYFFTQKVETRWVYKKMDL